MLEISYHILFDFKDEDVPLIKSEDIFINKSPEASTPPYMINIIMEKADKELMEIIKESGYKPMNFFNIFILIKDLLTGLTRMHLANLVHRDIKP